MHEACDLFNSTPSRRRPDPTPWLQYTVQAQALMQNAQVRGGFSKSIVNNQVNQLLDSVLHPAQELEIENVKLKETIKQYREEFADLRNQGAANAQLPSFPSSPPSLLFSPTRGHHQDAAREAQGAGREGGAGD